MNTQKTVAAFQRIYVKIMMAVVGRALVATSRSDDEVRKELSILPSGYTMQMLVPSGPGFMVKVEEQGHLTLVSDRTQKPDLSITFKHLSFAFLVFSFQESTARSFANDRMVLDGEVSHAIRLVRCLNKMEAIILPRFVARLAVKRYPRISLGEKVSKAARVYGLVAKHLVLGR
ncbi:hypothetical protein M3P05_07090 [Sansalvadorimonas sp. 2012CJ34-2]|uniref:SCP2 domain-containing protein n=1 Tax=Parendozoicomonas callyspongiae TaxID=2942213 RepID=A0ABT0PE96_9GAMM|nr:hypothetical protein [Sansalvadorimonas sp. 2012CJ34-2]MCL6269702.1 hypothetical protein [Sansalvadorimonas sp. 2012CJ34-2]